MNNMDKQRLLELLSYAKVCFEKCTNPFEITHLRKKNVSANECRDLSDQIGSIIDEWLYGLYSPEEVETVSSQAEQDFKETQEE